jgi:outer membrane protein assembly factor BamA
VGQAIENMQGRLRANGLFQAKIQYALDRYPSTEEVGIDFDLNAGDRARFDGVKLTGTFNRTPEDVIKSTGWRRGFAFISWPGWRQATDNRVQSGLERVRQSFQREDRLQVRVTLERLEYHDKTNTVTPTLMIDSGPVIEVHTIGASVSRGRLRQLIPIYEERTVDRSLLLEGARNLVDYFQSQGYFEAAADFTEESEAAGVQVIDYTIARNARHPLLHQRNHSRAPHHQDRGIPAPPLWPLFAKTAGPRPRFDRRLISHQRIPRRRGYRDRDR